MIGVAPDGTPVGTNVDGEARARVHRILGGISQPGRYQLSALTVDEADLLAVTVALDRVESLRLLKDLVTSGDLEQVGTRRGTRYALRRAAAPNESGEP